MFPVDEWRATCYHEAAHAVFAIKVHRGMVRYVSANESYCADRTEGIGTPASAWRGAICTLAGSFAEMFEIWGEIVPQSFTDICEGAEIEADEELYEERGDRYELLRCLEGMEGNIEENYAEVVRDTEKELRRLWPQVTAVAERLSEAGRLEGEEVAALIESVNFQRRSNDA
jgi:hypothetical protein